MLHYYSTGTENVNKHVEWVALNQTFGLNR